MIRIINLRKQYGRLAAVDNLNIEVAPGEIFGFLGPNGAGKTTTIRVMMGILRASSGRVILGGHDVEQEPQQAKAIAGFIPDRPFIYEKLSGKEFLTFIAKLHRMESARLTRRIDELLEYFELANWQDELVEGFSHGMKQRLVLCAALVHEPRILIVDEPMVGLDPKGARTIKDLFRSLAKNGTTVFLSTHSISVAEEVCHRIGIIQKGHLIASGTMADIYRLTRGHDSNLEDVFLELTRQQADLALPREGRV
ncbi:MAG TPA: ABC transporter ATP-binding protein [Candidatus Binatia bacterium]|jgi:ABC-2 type transport system ATP-binding protein|nr:ABC transporter ATP-binding protein [Candidatus Binatia bacterium]